MTDTALDAAIAATPAPKITLADIHGKIANVAYHAHDHLTLCILTLKNGFFVVGKSAPVSVENFSLEIGQKVAHNDAVRQVWELEGYLLRQRLFEEQEWDKELQAAGHPPL